MMQRVFPGVTATITAEDTPAEVGATGDGQLWQHVRAGQRESFHAVYERHSGRVNRACQRMGLPPHEAEDVVAETFMAAWQARDELVVGDAGLAPWLVTVATNLTRKRFRALARGSAAAQRLAAEPRVPGLDPAVRVTENDARMQNLLLAQECLNELSAGDQELIALCVLAAIPPCEVAESRGVPAATVRSQLLRARRRLQRRYNEKSIAEDGS